MMRGLMCGVLVSLNALSLVATSDVSAQEPDEFLAEGRFGQGFQASGGGQWGVHAQGLPFFHSFPFTVELWARVEPRAVGAFNILVAHDPKESTMHWELYTFANTGQLAFYMPGFAPPNLTAGPVVVDGEWHYLAVTCDGFRVQLFVDGEAVGDQAIHRTGGMPMVPGDLTVGLALTGESGRIGCDGVLDDVRVSNVVRDCTVVPTEPMAVDESTVGLWRFEEVDDEGRFVDASTNANNAGVLRANRRPVVLDADTVSGRRRMRVGTGLSALDDPYRAGADAALDARRGLGRDEASLVLVFDALADTEEAKARLLEGVAWFFPGDRVFGCSTFAPITDQGNTGTVGVLALGSEFRISTAWADLGEGGHTACGRALAAQIMPLDAEEGQLLLLLGSCHVPLNDELVSGVRAGLGEVALPIAGGAASHGEFVYDRGQVKRKGNLAILLAGDFAVTGDLVQGRGADAVISTAAAAAAAVGREPAPGLVLAFNCASRMGALGARRAEELAAILDAFDGTSPVTVFGFYGSGEIGWSTGSPEPRGVGEHLSLVGITPEEKSASPEESAGPE